MQLFRHHFSGLLRLRLSQPDKDPCRRRFSPRLLKFLGCCFFLGCGVGLGLASLPAIGQIQEAGTSPGIITNRVETAAYSVSERGPNHRTWERVTARTNEEGRILYHTNAYTEVA